MMNLNPPKYFADRVDQFLYPKIDAQKEFMASIKKNPPPYDSSRNGGRGRVAVRFPSVLSGSLSHTLDLDAPLRIAAQRKLTCYRQQYADNKNGYTRGLGWRMHCGAEVTESSPNKQHHLSISHFFSPRMHGEFSRLLFLQAHRETSAHFHATGLPSQQNRSDNAFRFKRAAFYMGLKSKVGLVAAKSSALRINLNIQGCSVVAPSLHAPSHAPLLLPLLLSHNLPLPRVH
jgi:hypothetical protein